MTKRMLIDATQAEETRVVMTSGNRVEDFDFEVTNRRPLKGNIYLAQVTRVEPSLQAAFVEYGGNRQGFLAFNEIHPDYYRIPMEDRQALLAEQIEDSKLTEDINDVDDNVDTPSVEFFEPKAEQAIAENLDSTEASKDQQHQSDNGVRTPREVEVNANRKRYKIQEVIARRQIMLIQVVKEERGNKGAALTTFLSLAGRYCVLMPNTPRGGGVSRKIISALDRKRLKVVVEGLSVPDGMAVIVRTAGSQRTKAEIKRDYEYLIRLWNQIRESTLISTAPFLVHEEANLIKRSIRDLYARDIDEILVEGDDGYRLAKSFMKTLMPSHARRVQSFSSGGIPLFSHFQIEGQLDSLYEPIVQLKSGGYLVLNQTEALVAVDVNSGRSTRERNIEETALKTNLEAAEEVARQLRLRDLAGLVVIDFIDMYESKNQHSVERKMKEVIKVDRARIQISRISQFGLMELSRQRLRPSVTEASTQPCPHCAGSGLRRSIDSAALQVLRNIEEEGLRQEASEIIIHLPSEVGFYLLNRKRDILNGMEQRYAFQILLEPDDKFLGAEHKIERTIKKPVEDRITDIVSITNSDSEENANRETQTVEDNDEKPPSQKSKQHHRKPYRPNTVNETPTELSDDKEIDTKESALPNVEADEMEDDDGAKRRKRRGKRGGRRRTKKLIGEDNNQSNENQTPSTETTQKEEAPDTKPTELSAVNQSEERVDKMSKSKDPEEVSTKTKQNANAAEKPKIKRTRRPRNTTELSEENTISNLTNTVEQESITSMQVETKTTSKPSEVTKKKAKTSPARRGWWNLLIK
jgi:ribonuclease E